MAVSLDNATFLVAVADELGRVREGLDGVERLIVDLVRRLPSQDRGAVLGQAQALDALIQQVEALSGLLRGVAQGDEPEQAVERLTLGDMAARLGSAAGMSAPRGEAGKGDDDGLTLF